MLASAEQLAPQHCLCCACLHEVEAEHAHGHAGSDRSWAMSFLQEIPPQLPAMDKDSIKQYLTSPGPTVPCSAGMKASIVAIQPELEAMLEETRLALDGYFATMLAQVCARPCLLFLQQQCRSLVLQS